MSRESVAALGRAFALTGMVDTVLVDRLNTEIINQSNGVVTKEFLPVYIGPCAVKMGPAQSSRRVHTVGEAALRFLTLELRLPVTAVGVRSDDRVTITLCVHDPELTGLQFFIAGEQHGTWLVQRSPSMTEVLK